MCRWSLTYAFYSISKVDKGNACWWQMEADRSYVWPGVKFPSVNSVVLSWADGKATSGATHALFIIGTHTHHTTLPDSARVLSELSLSIYTDSPIWGWLLKLHRTVLLVSIWKLHSFMYITLPQPTSYCHLTIVEYDFCHYVCSSIQINLEIIRLILFKELYSTAFGYQSEIYSTKPN